MNFHGIINTNLESTYIEVTYICREIKTLYFFRFILLDPNIDVSRHISVVDTLILASNNIDRMGVLE
jgi:hypothetical protein